MTVIAGFAIGWILGEGIFGQNPYNIVVSLLLFIGLVVELTK